MLKTTLTAESTALQVQSRLKQLYTLVHDIEKERVKNEVEISALKRQQEKISQEDRVHANQSQRLENLYKKILNGSKQEEELLRKALHEINEIRSIRNEHRMQVRKAHIKQTFHRGEMMDMIQSSAETLQLFVSRYGEAPPPLCGAIPAESNYIAKPGDMVAALVKISNEGENWILAEVVSWNSTSNKYVIDDIDDEQKDRYTLSKSRVVPLPLMRANPKTDEIALFPKGTLVMALFPQTTCFYEAIVSELPSEPTDEYTVVFKDPGSQPNSCAELIKVAQRYVIAVKQSKSSKMA